MYFGKKTVKKGALGGGRLGLKMNAKAKSLGRKYAGVASRLMTSPGMKPSTGYTTMPVPAYKRVRRM